MSETFLSVGPAIVERQDESTWRAQPGYTGRTRLEPPDRGIGRNEIPAEGGTVTLRGTSGLLPNATATGTATRTGRR